MMFPMPDDFEKCLPPSGLALAQGGTRLKLYGVILLGIDQVGLYIGYHGIHDLVFPLGCMVIAVAGSLLVWQGARGRMPTVCTYARSIALPTSTDARRGMPSVRSAGWVGLLWLAWVSVGQWWLMAWFGGWAAVVLLGKCLF